MPVNSVIQLRRGTAAQWTSANPVLANGEPGYETDTGKEKRGDGTTAWTSLAYFAPGTGLFAPLASPALTGSPTVNGSAPALLTSGNVAGFHKNTDSSTYGSWFTFGNGPGSMGGAATGTPAEGWAPLVAYHKFGDYTGGSNASVTHTTQAVSFIAAYYGPTVDDSAEAGSVAVLLKDTGTGFTQAKKVTGWESDVQIEGSNTVTGANTYCLTGGGRLVMAGSSNTDTGYGWKVSAATGNNSLVSTGTVGTWHGFRDDLYNPAGTTRSSSESVHGLNRITSEQSFLLSRANFTGFAQMDLRGSDDSNAALFRIQQPSGASRSSSDGAIANGSRKLSAPLLAVTSADIGKTITVTGAAAGPSTLTTKVHSYLSDGTIILDAAATATVASGATVTVTETDLVGLRITQGTGAGALSRPIEIYDNTGTLVWNVSRTGTTTIRNSALQVQNSSGVTSCSLNVNGSVQVGTTGVPASKIYSGSGVPGTISGATAGDFYFRVDTPATANQRLYVCTATNTWSALL